MMVPHPTPHPAASTQSQHEDDCHQTGVAFLSHPVWGRLGKVTHSHEGKASPPVSSKPLPAQLSGCSLL